MFFFSLSRKEKQAIARSFLRLALKMTLVIVAALLFWPAASKAQNPVTETQGIVKTTGTGEGNIVLWLPEGSVNEPFLAAADYIAEEDLPEGVFYPANMVGPAFTFGLWVGDGMTLTRFDPSIVLNVRYEDDAIPPSALPDEERLHLMMYHPAAQAWVKLCSSVDIYENVVSAALSFPTPLDGKGSSLMALVIDDTPTLDQAVDAQGTTTISLQGSNLGFQVLFDTVEVGAHFAITTLPGVTDSGPVKLFSRPVDIKGCSIDHTTPYQNNRELTSYPKPLRVGFYYDSDTLSRAGGRSRLTLVNFQNGQWIDEEALGSRVIRDDEIIMVDTWNRGTFSMAAR